ncbi:hypothetical protein [Candidatus Fokinia crypta]|uniref:Uncharacterized protein n=1 Tax=Candidatus Fokinia crypta TaxID=1920990 RepID=A0ABZ0UQP4_9RICK|nr:hypothetical protein [Candidatus Fokinia cryptica]WPX97987.1 hypothetical protein Fokcrypt_00514 [Candidatus Fokinia cryptica]
MSSTNIVLCDHQERLSDKDRIVSKSQFIKSYTTDLSLFQNAILNLHFYDKFTQPMVICASLAHKNIIISQLQEIGIRKAILLCENSLYGSAISLMLAVQYLFSTAAMASNHQIICTMLARTKLMNFDLLHTRTITEYIVKAQSKNMHLSNILCFAVPTSYFDEDDSYIEIKKEPISLDDTLYKINSFPEMPYSKEIITKIKNSFGSYNEFTKKSIRKINKNKLNRNIYLSEVGIYYSSVKVLCENFQLYMNDYFQETKKLFINDSVKTEHLFVVKEIPSNINIKKMISSSVKYSDFSQSILRHSSNTIVCIPENKLESTNWNEVYHTSKVDSKNLASKFSHLSTKTQEQDFLYVPSQQSQKALHKYSKTLEQTTKSSEAITYECQDSSKIMVKELKAKREQPSNILYEEKVCKNFQELKEKRIFTMYSPEDLLSNFLAYNIPEDIVLSSGNIMLTEKPTLLIAQNENVIWELNEVVIIAHKKYIHKIRNIIKEAKNTEEAYEILQQLFKGEEQMDKVLLKMILEEHKNSFIF